MSRRVVLLCGPPGAGKTTAAKQSGLKVFDRDDSEWESERQFTEAIAKLAIDPNAQAVVIRSGASSSARNSVRSQIGATHTFVLLEDPDELARRVRQRARADRVYTIAGIKKWFARHDREDGVQIFPGWSAIGETDLGVTSEDW
ncbi:nucleoside/nucleotide kinase family protein [Arthrobacter sp. TmT3-37]